MKKYYYLWALQVLVALILVIIFWRNLNKGGFSFEMKLIVVGLCIAEFALGIAAEILRK